MILQPQVLCIMHSACFFTAVCAGYSTGGNNAHLAPEVLNAKPGPRRFINYTKQPVWAAGVLVYELAGECMHTYNFCVSPRINEKGCTEREIVSGGLVASACSYQPRSDVFPPFVYVINFSLSAGGEHPCMYRLGLQARVKGTCNCVATLFSQTPGHQNPFQSGTIDQRGYSIDALPPLKYTYCTHSKFCQPLNSKLTALVRDMLQVEPTDRPSLQDCVKRVMQISA